VAKKYRPVVRLPDALWEEFTGWAVSYAGVPVARFRHGRSPTDGRFLDDPLFEPILAGAEALSVPIYIHPGIPSEKVREAHFNRLPGNFSFALAVSSWGWHMETAIHVLRLILVGLSIAILVSRSSSDTWARRYRSCWTASTKRHR
jgi:hypothetical protein